MEPNAWQELFGSLELLDIFGKPLATPTNDQLDEFEATWRFRLPKGFRDYAKVFGAGTLGEEYSVRSPGYSVPEKSEDEVSFNWQADLGAFNTSIRQTPLNEEPGRQYYLFEDPDQIRRSVFFGNNGAGEIIGWV